MEAFKATMVSLAGDAAATEALLNKQFAAIDSNSDGNIDRAEIIAFYLAHFAGSEQAQAEEAADKLIKILDKDGDNQISKDEYIKGMFLLQAAAAAGHWACFSL